MVLNEEVVGRDLWPWPAL